MYWIQFKRNMGLLYIISKGIKSTFKPYIQNFNILKLVADIYKKNVKNSKISLNAKFVINLNSNIL